MKLLIACAVGFGLAWWLKPPRYLAPLRGYHTENGWFPSYTGH